MKQKTFSPKVGDVIVAINQCEMQIDKRPTLIVGKEYVVTRSDGRQFCVIDDDPEGSGDHWFDVSPMSCRDDDWGGAMFKFKFQITTHRPLHEIAKEIRSDWKKPYFGAVPYIQAMAQMINVNDRYGIDGAESIVRYFLSNASSWRGETARRIKKELKDMLNENI